MLVVTSCRKEEEKTDMSPVVPVKTEKVIRQKMILPVHTSGKISTSAETKLSFKIGGIIEKIFVSEGDYVEKGKLLAQLNLSEIEARLLQAQNGFDKMERDYSRVKKLYADEVATLEQFQNTETAFNVAKSDLEIARFNYKYAKITAPANGQILKKLCEENELTNAGTPLIIFGMQSEGWIVKVGVTDKDILKIRANDSAHVVIDAFPDKVFSAKVTEIGLAANPYNGTYEVELKINTGNFKLISGLVAGVDIYPSGGNEFYIIPISALNEADKNRGFVYTPSKNNSVRKLNVFVESIIDDKVAVSKGLESIRTVITEGSEYLNSYSKIDIVN